MVKIDRFLVYKWYWRFLWMVAAGLIYLVVVEIQLAGSMNQLYSLTQQNYTSSAPNTLDLKGLHLWRCVEVSPGAVPLHAFLFAANPLNWGNPLTAYLEAAYCNKSVLPSFLPIQEGNSTPIGIGLGK